MKTGAPASRRHPLLRILALTVREFRRNLLLLRASVLTLTVVFALVPGLALTTAVLKGLGLDNQLRQAAELFLSGLAPLAAAPSGAPGQPPPVDLLTHLHQAVNQIFAYVEQTDFTTLGVFGVGGLFLSLLSLTGGIDQAMNAIWHLQGRRRFSRQLLKYPLLLLFLPLSINLALAIEAALQTPHSFPGFTQLLPLAWASQRLLRLLPAAMLLLTLTTLYRLLPNARVRFLPALAGGAGGTFAWLGSQALFLHLQFGVARYNTIYGSFATVPLFLLWLLIGWLVFLAGAELTFAVQHQGQSREVPEAGSALTRLALACQLLLLARRDRHRQRATTIASLAARLPATREELRQLITRLAAAGLLTPVKGEREGYSPAHEDPEFDPATLVAAVREEPERQP